MEFLVAPEDVSFAPDDEQCVEEVAGIVVALRVADDADDPERGAESSEATHPPVRLTGNPVGSEQRLEAVTGRDALARYDPCGAHLGRRRRRLLDERSVLFKCSVFGREVQQPYAERTRSQDPAVTQRRPRHVSFTPGQWVAKRLVVRA